MLKFGKQSVSLGEKIIFCQFCALKKKKKKNDPILASIKMQLLLPR